MRPPTPLLPPPDDEVIRAIDATRRGMRLLLQNLNETQRDQFRWSNFFEVIGGTTGRRYRIRLGLVQNVEELDQTGKRICGWCFAPFGNLVEGDVMLAQKLALELFEIEALQIANRFGWREDDTVSTHYDEYYRMFHNP